MKNSVFYNLMVFCLGLLLIAGLSACSESQENRVSPPATASAQVGDVTVTINYSQPSVKGRKIWGDLVPYNQVWRTGANEATVFEINKDIQVEGKKLAAGKYALFSVPQNGNTWKVLFNSEFDQWGAYKYKKEKDVLEVEAKATKTDKFTELLTFEITPDGLVKILWENLEVSFQLK